MKTPGWLADEFTTLARQRMKGDISRDEAITSAIETATAKDPDLMAAIHEEWFGQRGDTALARLKKESAERGRTLAATGDYQGTFDEICSDFFPRATFGPLTTLEDLWEWHRGQCEMTANFARRDETREARLLEMTTAAGGDLTVGWEKAERARLGLLGDGAAAAEG